MNHLVEQGTRLLTGVTTGELPCKPRNTAVTLLTLGIFSVGASYAWAGMEKFRARRIQAIGEAIESADVLVVE